VAKESDIISIAVGETWRHAGMVAKASGSAITAGTVNYYLKAKTGDNAGKWWKDSDQTWAAAETANAMTHDADGNWTIELSESPFTDGVLYVEYAKESGDLHIAGEGRLVRGIGDVSAKEAKQDEILAAVTGISGGAGGAYKQTVTVTDGTDPVPNADVRIFSSSGTGAILVDTDTTDAAGLAEPTADAGVGYELRVSATGYATVRRTFSVAADATLADVVLTAVSFSPPTDEEQVTAWGYVYDENGLVEPGATVVLKHVSAGDRKIYDSAERTLTADGNGLVSAAVWADGSEYRIRRGGARDWSDPFAPEDDGDEDLPQSYKLPGLLGRS
jgi:hypothetical protein